MSTISDQTSFEEFRKRCEDKNTLNSIGSLYVGTGKSEQTTSGGANIYETIGLKQPAYSSNPNSYVLAVSQGQECGLEWKNVVSIINAEPKLVINKAVSCDIATDADKALRDSDGNIIKTTYYKRGAAEPVITAINAQNSANATNTDFTNAEWIDTTVPYADLVAGATYEVVPYETIAGRKRAYSHGFITYDTTLVSDSSTNIMVKLYDGTSYNSNYGVSGHPSENILFYHKDINLILNNSGRLRAEQNYYGVQFYNGDFSKQDEETKQLYLRYRRIR